MAHVDTLMAVISFVMFGLGWTTHVVLTRLDTRPLRKEREVLLWVYRRRPSLGDTRKLSDLGLATFCRLLQQEYIEPTDNTPNPNYGLTQAGLFALGLSYEKKPEKGKK